jgi:hypothetical protein
MPANSDSPPPSNHIFVDFENVPQLELSIIGQTSVSFTLLLGAKQTKIDAALVEKLMEHAASVQLIRLTSSGKNALDFAVAYYLGQAALADPAGYFHIVSKDTGFDPLIKHLKTRHVNVRRHNDFSTLTLSGSQKPVRDSKPSPKSSPEAKAPTTMQADSLPRALEHLRKNTSNRPRRKNTLVSHLLAVGGKSSTEAGVLVLIDRLIELGDLSLDDKDRVSYHL